MRKRITIQRAMILTAKKGTAFEQVLKELYDQNLRNKEEAIEILTDYYGVKPVEFEQYWCVGYTCMISARGIRPEYIPETLKKGVKETDNGLLTVDRRTKVGREFLLKWETYDCAKGLSGESLEQFGIYTLDPDAHRYCYWYVCTDDDGLYCLILQKYAARRLTDEAKEMMTIDIQRYD